MAHCKCMQLRIANMSDNVIKHYTLMNLTTPDGYVYCEIQKGMYGQPQARIIAQQLLEEQLWKNGYRKSATTPGLWKQDTWPISITLVVDDFGVKYGGKENTQHLLDTMQQFYKCLCGWEGKQFCGLTIKWNYNGWKVHLLMPNKVIKALDHFWHPPPCKRQDQPSISYVKLTYGEKTQYSWKEDGSPTLDKAGKKFI